MFLNDVLKHAQMLQTKILNVMIMVQDVSVKMALFYIKKNVSKKMSVLVMTLSLKSSTNLVRHLS